MFSEAGLMAAADVQPSLFWARDVAKPTVNCNRASVQQSLQGRRSRGVRTDATLTEPI